jgi:hypothetical protein
MTLYKGCSLAKIQPHSLSSFNRVSHPALRNLHSEGLTCECSDTIPSPLSSFSFISLVTVFPEPISWWITDSLYLSPVWLHHVWFGLSSPRLHQLDGASKRRRAATPWRCDPFSSKHLTHLRDWAREDTLEELLSQRQRSGERGDSQCSPSADSFLAGRWLICGLPFQAGLLRAAVSLHYFGLPILPNFLFLAPLSVCAVYPKSSS